MPKASTLDLNALLIGADVRRECIERLTVVGQSKDLKRAIAWLAERGFRIIQSGPYTDREMFPSVDVTQFKFVAEREL